MLWSQVFDVGAYMSACGTIWLAAERTEKLLKKPTLQAIATTVRTSAYAKVLTELPNEFVRVFGLVFTDRLWSLKGFLRSAIASLLFVSCLLLFAWSQIPDTVSTVISFKIPPPESSGSGGDSSTIGYWIALVFVNRETKLDLELPILTLFGFPILYNIFADYIALIVTQRALTQLLGLSTRQRLLAIAFTATALLLISYSFFVFCLTLTGIAEWLAEGYSLQSATSLLSSELQWYTRLFGMALLFPVCPGCASYLLPEGSPLPRGEWTPYVVYGAYIYSTFIGLAWLAVVTLASLLSAAVYRTRWIGPWVDRHFQLKQHPLEVGACLMIAAISIVFWPILIVRLL